MEIYKRRDSARLQRSLPLRVVSLLGVLVQRRGSGHQTPQLGHQRLVLHVAVVSPLEIRRERLRGVDVRAIRRLVVGGVLKSTRARSLFIRFASFRFDLERWTGEWTDEWTNGPIIRSL